MVSERLKNIIFKQLYKELSKVEIIPYLESNFIFIGVEKDSVYFIDRENKYWYFEYEKSGKLWWRYDFFVNFFVIFSLELDDCKKVMGDWVEEVLNCKVNTTLKTNGPVPTVVEEVLNCKVNTTHSWHHHNSGMVEDVLNCKVIQPNQ